MKTTLQFKGSRDAEISYLCTFFRVPDGPGDIPREGLLRVDHEGAPAGVVPGKAGDHT